MTHPLVSIIIPVYNVEPYLSRCLDSILIQNNKSWEALLIDDGSCDGSSKICDEYEQKDSRFRVFHKENGGVSSARNLGLDKTQGEWIAFVDGDDEVDPDYITIPDKYADCDVLQKGSKSIYDDGREEMQIQETYIVEGQEAVFHYFINKRTMALWNKLIKRNVIGEDRFCINIPIGEDGLFFFTIIDKVKKWGFSDCGRYFYYIRTNSAMRGYNNCPRIDIRLNLCNEAKRIASVKNMLPLYENFVADQYIPTFWRRHSYFTKEQSKRYYDIINDIHLFNLKYLSKKHLLKFIIIRIKTFFVSYF